MRIVERELYGERIYLLHTLETFASGTGSFDGVYKKSLDCEVYINCDDSSDFSVRYWVNYQPSNYMANEKSRFDTLSEAIQYYNEI